MTTKKKLVTPRTLKGFRDLLPGEALAKKNMISKLQEVFESFGFGPIETPHLEYTDVLINETEGEIGKQLYRFEDNGGRDVCLRFDLTVPFARYAVQHKNELGMPFKRYAIGTNFRGENPQLGRYREFMQCDFDIIGVDSGSADAEIVQVIKAALLTMGVKNFTIRINNRKIMNGIAEHYGLVECVPEILRIIDKIDKIGEEKVRSSLLEELSLSSEQVDIFMEFVSLSGGKSCQEIFSIAEKYENLNEATKKGFQELRELAAILDGLEWQDCSYKIDFAIARGLGYYTGIIYETILNDFPEIGSICSGGRYDNLTQNFSKEPAPGVGASVGIDRLMAALQEMKLITMRETPARVLVTQMDKELCAYSHRVASEFRASDIPTEVYPAAAKLKKQFQYADRKGHEFIVLIGEDEAKANKITVKNLKTAEQETLTIEEAVKLTLLH